MILSIPHGLALESVVSSARCRFRLIHWMTFHPTGFNRCMEDHCASRTSSPHPPQILSSPPAPGARAEKHSPPPRRNSHSSPDRKSTSIACSTQQPESVKYRDRCAGFFYAESSGMLTPAPQSKAGERGGGR